MRRIFLIASAVAVIFALWAVSAGACIVFEQPTVCAPAANSPDNPGNGGQNQAGSPEEKKQLKDNQGTQKAEDKSPAIEPGCTRY
jgi:hypothetical protein